MEPSFADIKKEDMQKSLIRVRNRADELILDWTTQKLCVEPSTEEREAWNKSITDPESKGLLTIAYRYADLENDFEVVKDLNAYTAKRYAEFTACLPTLKEMDHILAQLDTHSEDDKEFWDYEPKADRMKRLRVLREAIKHLSTH